MTIEELYKYCVRNGYENKEIKININCNDDYYSDYDIPINEDDLLLTAENVEISVCC